MKKLIIAAAVIAALVTPASADVTIQLPGFELWFKDPATPTPRPYYYKSKQRLRHFRTRHENYCYRRYRDYRRSNNTFRVNKKRRMKCWSPYLNDARRYGYRK